MGYIAALTSTAKLCLGVLVIALRDPVYTAKQLQAIDVLSNGRLEIGIGIGGEFPGEWRATGIPRGERAGRTDEILAWLRDLMAGAPLELDGQHFDREVPSLSPSVDRAITLWLGGYHDAALERAARNRAHWVGIWVTPEQVRGVRRRRAALELDDPDFEPRTAVSLVASLAPDPRLAERNAREYCDSFGIDYERVGERVAVGDPQSVGSYLEPLVDAGVDTFTFSIAGDDVIEQIEELRDSFR